MKTIHSPKLLETYIHQYGLEEVFPASLRSQLALHQFAPNEHVCFSGDAVLFLYFLVDGQLNVSSANEDGATITITRISPLASIGAMEFFSKSDFCQTVLATDKSILIAIPVSLIKQKLNDNIAFYRLLCRHLSQRRMDSSKKYAETLLYPAKTRLLIYFTHQADAKGVVSHYRNEDAANYLSISTRHLRRLLASCEKEDLLHREGQGLVLHLALIRRTQVLLPF